MCSGAVHKPELPKWRLHHPGEYAKVTVYQITFVHFPVALPGPEEDEEGLQNLDGSLQLLDKFGVAVFRFGCLLMVFYAGLIVMTFINTQTSF